MPSIRERVLQSKDMQKMGHMMVEQTLVPRIAQMHANFISKGLSDEDFDFLFCGISKICLNHGQTMLAFDELFVSSQVLDYTDSHFAYEIICKIEMDPYREQKKKRGIITGAPEGESEGEFFTRLKDAFERVDNPGPKRGKIMLENEQWE